MIPPLPQGLNTTPTTTPSEEEEDKGIPGFKAVYAIIGFIATILYLTLKGKKEVHKI